MFLAGEIHNISYKNLQADLKWHDHWGLACVIMLKLPSNAMVRSAWLCFAHIAVLCVNATFICDLNAVDFLLYTVLWHTNKICTKVNPTFKLKLEPRPTAVYEIFL